MVRKCRLGTNARSGLAHETTRVVPVRPARSIRHGFLTKDIAVILHAEFRHDASPKTGCFQLTRKNLFGNYYQKYKTLCFMKISMNTGIFENHRPNKPRVDGFWFCRLTAPTFSVYRFHQVYHRVKTGFSCAKPGFTSAGSDTRKDISGFV